jgi:hypothetical protein
MALIYLHTAKLPCIGCNDTEKETEELGEITVRMPLRTPQIPHVYSFIKPSPPW